MAVKVRRYSTMLEQETRKAQPLIKAQLKAATAAGGMGTEANQYQRPSGTDNLILAMLRAKKKMTGNK